MNRAGHGIGIPLLLGAVTASSACAQPAAIAPAPGFAFATAAEARAVLSARDDYVRATSSLERSARLRTADNVDEERFIRYMQDAAREWTDEQQKKLAPLIERLEQFLRGMKWKLPERVLIIQADASFEDDSPHTRANAIVLPATYYPRGPGLLAYVLSHEAFHVLTRYNSELKERLYAAIGFRRCEAVTIPPAIIRLRITNPDAVESRHTILVRYQGRAVEALPFVRFPSENIDPRAGFLSYLQNAWLLVDRADNECRARRGADNGVPPQAFEGLHEQVGRNTDYLYHPEEILADNFSRLYLTSLRGSTEGVPSPEILEKLRQILFE